MRLGTTVLRPARHVASMRVLVTDPCLVRSPDEYASGITEGVAGTPASLQPGTYVPVPVTPSFLAALKVPPVRAGSAATRRRPRRAA